MGSLFGDCISIHKLTRCEDLVKIDMDISQNVSLLSPIGKTLGVEVVLITHQTYHRCAK